MKNQFKSALTETFIKVKRYYQKIFNLKKVNELIERKWKIKCSAIGSTATVGLIVME